MAAILRRLESDKPGWAAQIAVRSAGLALLGLCAAAAWWLHRSVNQPPHHGATLLEFIAGLLAVASGCVGWALFGEGPGLFRLIPVPGRTILPFSN
ncbi:MAG: hypothetical protein ABW023_11735 [Sphingomonas sp.]